MATTDPGDAPVGEDPQPIELDKLVHEPARLLVMATLAVVEVADATFVLRQTGLTWGNLASHLARLEAAGYVAVEKRFVDRKPKTLLSLTPAGRDAMNDYRERMQRLLDGLPD